MSNNISTSVHLAAVNIGSLTAAGTNATILGGADALTTSAVICGIDVREYLPLFQRPLFLLAGQHLHHGECNAGNYILNALAEVTGPDSNATLTWETQTNSAAFALAMAPSSGFMPLVLVQPPSAQPPTAGRHLLQGGCMSRPD